MPCTQNALRTVFVKNQLINLHLLIPVIMAIQSLMIIPSSTWIGTWRETTANGAEAQWEKAARGTDGRIYPWGDNIDCSFANYYWISPDYRLWETQHYCRGDTTRVGDYEEGKSPYELYDMVGNVSEWVADWFGAEYEPNSLVINPAGSDTGVYRIARGGSWRDSSSYSSSLPLAHSIISNTLSAFDTKDDLVGCGLSFATN